MEQSQSCPPWLAFMSEVRSEGEVEKKAESESEFTGQPLFQILTYGYDWENNVSKTSGQICRVLAISD